jgi:hypothetical protein
MELEAGERIQACEWLLWPRFPASVHREGRMFSQKMQIADVAWKILHRTTDLEEE